MKTSILALVIFAFASCTQKPHVMPEGETWDPPFKVENIDLSKSKITDLRLSDLCGPVRDMRKPR